MTKRLLTVHHTPSPHTHDMLEADGYLLGSPANLGYMSAALLVAATLARRSAARRAVLSGLG